MIGFAVDALDAPTALRLIRNVPNTTQHVGYRLRLPMETLLALPGTPEHPEYPYTLAIPAAWSAGLHGDRELAERRAADTLAAETTGLGTRPDGEIDAVVLIARVLVEEPHPRCMGGGGGARGPRCRVLSVGGST